MTNLGIDTLHQRFWESDIQADAVIGIGSVHRQERLSVYCVLMRANPFQGGGGRSLLIVFGKPLHVESDSLGG